MTFFDITKSITLVAVVTFLWFYGGGFIKSFSTPFIPPAVIKTIDDNALKLSRLQANDKSVTELRNEFKEENSK